MKTTLDISDRILQELKAAAKERNTTMKDIVAEAVVAYLSPSQSGGRFALRDASYGGKGTQAGIAEGDWELIRGRIYEGRGGDRG